MRTRRWLTASLALLAVLLAVAAGLLLALPSMDLGAFAARRLSARLGRDARIGALHVTPGRWLRIELHDAALANIPGGTRPEMATLGALVAEVDALSLLHGPALVRKLDLQGFDLLLERVGDTPNWRMGEARKHDGPDYSGLPTMLDATLRARIAVRARSGKEFVVTLDGMRIAAPDAAAPVHVDGPGSYQGVPVDAALTFASFDAVRAAPKPVDSRIVLTSGDTRLAFQGTMTAPLDIDGAAGELTYDAPTPDVTARLLGAGAPRLPPLHLLGTLQRDDPEWHLMNVTGALGQAKIGGGDIDLVEGRPDKLALALDFDAVDLDALLPPGKPGAPSPSPSIAIGREPATEVDLKLTAASLAFDGLATTDPSLDASIRAGRIEVASLSFGTMGGQVTAQGSLEALDDAAQSRLSASAEMRGLDLGGLRRAMGGSALPLSGRLDGRLQVSGQGATLRDVERTAQGGAVATLAGGSISRDVVEKLSTDPRSLFRTAPGFVPISCGLGVLAVQGGAVAVQPLRLRTAAGTVVARGRIDILRGTLDLVVGSEAATTSAFALDVPIRLSGSLSDPSAVPPR